MLTSLDRSVAGKPPAVSLVRVPTPAGEHAQIERSLRQSLKKRSNHLSSREVEVLQLIAEGQPNKQIAAELGVSFKTADKHRQHLMAKLNIHDVAGLTRYAIAEGIIESTDRGTIG